MAAKGAAAFDWRGRCGVAHMGVGQFRSGKVLPDTACEGILEVRLPCMIANTGSCLDALVLCVIAVALLRWLGSRKSGCVDALAAA